MTVRAPGRGQVHLAAYLPGVGGATVGAGPRAGAQVWFSSFERLARTAERGLFDFLRLAEGPRPREHAGGVHDPAEAGRPEPITVLGVLATVTERVRFRLPGDAISPRREYAPARTSAAAAAGARPALRADDGKVTTGRRAR